METRDSAVEGPGILFAAYAQAHGERPSYGGLGGSVCLHAAATAALLLLAPKVVLHSILYTPRETVFVAAHESAPPARAAVPRPQLSLPQPAQAPRLFLPPASEVPPPAKPFVNAPPALPAGEPKLAPPLAAPALAAPEPAVRTNVFAEAPAAAPPAAFSVPQRTQVAGFDHSPQLALPATPKGNPVASSGFDAAPGARGPSRPAGAVQTGSFGQRAAAAPHSPAAAGRTASARFDQITENANAAPAPATVRQAGFDQPQAHAVAAPKPAPRASAPVRPVEILEKPKPVYTFEALRLKIEGSVELEVVFAASGELRVIRVVRGLGHGLDEAAAEAARRMRFKPATQAGSAIDQQATLHVVFQMATR